jgi:cell fate regulator YaaT (PSP1 superfamily)
MGCAGCTVCNTEAGGVKGCKSNGSCATGSCNRLNTYDWLSALDVRDAYPFDLVEVSFKNGSHKGFFILENLPEIYVGADVVVETGTGYDIGRVTLMGELVRLQLKKKRVRENTVFTPVIRLANERDLERLDEARQLDIPTLIKARAISRSLDLDMKIGDVEYQGDKRKATFYYTADGRVDFRELIRIFAREFRVKIEMRQIGARQESSRIGGIGSCGRELCCSTWLSDFKSVSTTAARYQNLAINQAKLSGQCGRLKCCLNFELDTYMEAIESFPERADRIETQKGKAILVKTDIFKGLLFYAYEQDHGRGKLYPQTIDMVKEIQQSAVRGNLLPDFKEMEGIIKPDEFEGGGKDYSDVTGAVELPEEIRRKKKKSGRFQDRNEPDNRSSQSMNRPGVNRPDNRPPSGNRPDGNRPTEQNRPDNRPQTGNRPDGNRPPEQNRPDNRQNTGNRPQQGNRPNTGERPTGNRTNEGSSPEQRRPGGNRPPFRQGGFRPGNKPNENRREDNDQKSES